MRLNLTSYIKKHLREVSLCSETGYINWVFNGNCYYFLGYTSTYFEALRIDEDPNMYGNYRIHSDIIRIICSYDAIDFVVGENSIDIKGIRGDSVQFGTKIIKEDEISFISSNYVNLTKNLKNARLYDLGLLKEFDRLLSMIKDGGIMFKDGYVYTEGDGFKCFGVTDNKIELFLTTALVKKLIKLVDQKALMTDLGNFMICQNNNFYFGFKKMRVDKIENFSAISNFPVTCEVTLDYETLMEKVSSITTKDNNLIINPVNKTLRVKSKIYDLLFLMPINECKVFSDDQCELILDLSMLKSAMRAVTYSKTIVLRGYKNFTLANFGSIMFLFRNVVI